MDTPPAESFETYRHLLFSIAYRMLGSAMEAEDMVQETFLRYQSALEAGETIRAPKAYLSTVITRLCLDQLKSAREKRETYIGPWLPEPILTEGAALNPAKIANEYDTISMAFMVLLESLNPVERAVFLLREVFDYGYDEIAQIVDKEEAACRQIYHRAKAHVAERRPRYRSTPEAHRAILDRFIDVMERGDLEGLMALLAEDVELWADGGGKALAVRKPLLGRDAVSRSLNGFMRLLPDFRMELHEVNGRQAMLLVSGEEIITVLTYDTDEATGTIRAIRIVRNPDKLGGVKN